MDYSKDRKSIDEILEFLKSRRFDGGPYTPEEFEKYLHDYAERLQAALNRDRAVRNAANKRKPRRNCDVGDEREQRERFHDFCHCKCDGCPINENDYDQDFDDCALKWSQLPYEEKNDEH